MPMLSWTSGSKKLRARRGSSKTNARETSACRIENSHQYPALRSASVNGVGILEIQRSKKPRMSEGPKRSQIAWRRFESSFGGPATTKSIASQMGEDVGVVRGISVPATPSWPRWLPDAPAARALVRATSTDLYMFSVVRRVQ